MCEAQSAEGAIAIGLGFRKEGNMRALYLLIFAALVISPVVGCGGEGGSEGQGEAATTGDVGDAVQGAAGAVEEAGEQVAAAAESFRSDALAKLDEYEGGLNTLKEGAKSLENAELNQLVEGIGEKISAARGAVSGLEVDKLADLNAQKGELESKIGGIKGDLDQAQKKFQDLKSKLPKLPGQG